MMFARWKKSFSHAFAGIATAFKTEQSFRVQSFAAVLAIAMSMVFHVSHGELIVILLLCAAVLTLEIVNSVFERLVDTFKPRIHPMVKEVKDLMAAAVLLTSIFAAIIGVLIFYPYILLLILR